MTVASQIPIVEYNGNGVVTKFDWDWEMIEDSTIGVLVDNEQVTNYNLEDQSVIFDTPPDDGAFIQIYRRTQVWMPEDYVAYGRFHPDKTELSVDRATLIAQERMGDAVNSEPPNGIVGGANLSISRTEYTITVHSERGSDAVVPMWSPDDDVPPVIPPDPSILWAGTDIQTNRLSTSAGSCIFRFLMDLVDGDPANASAEYPVNNISTFVDWVDVDPSGGDYWMRVYETGTPNPTLRINDGVYGRVLGEEFAMLENTSDAHLGAYVIVDTFGDTVPSTQVADVQIDICADDSGAPDGAWVSRNVRLEARLYA